MVDGAVIEKDPNFTSPHYVPVTKETLEEAKSRYLNNRRRQKQLKDGRTLSKISFFSNLEDLEEEESGNLVPNPAMEQGKPLPDDLGPFPQRLLGKPVDEIDRARKTDETFIVVAKRFGSTNILRFSNSNSLWCLSPLNPVRRIMLKVLSHQAFDILVIATILVNCVFMALDQPVTTYWSDIDPRINTPPTVQPPSRLHLDIAEYTFTAIYVMEMIVKIVSRGFILKKFTYLRDPWNWLDFAVIILAFITFALQFARVDAGNFAVIRSFRVLRALKTISIVPGLKSIINALLGSMKMLFEVILLTFFVLLIFSLLALQLFMGSLLQKCVLNLDITEINETEQYWYEHTQNSSNWLYYEGETIVCSNVSLFGQMWSGCNNPNYTCLPNIGENPNDGYTNFDNIGSAMLTSFQLITLDFWENVYNLIIRAQGPLSIVFFLLTCMLGSFYLINLMLAVVAMAYTEEMENIGKEKEQRKKTKDNVLDYDVNKLKSLAEKKKKRKEKKKKQKQEKAGQSTSKGDVHDETTIGSTASITTDSSKISNIDDGVEIIQAAYEDMTNKKEHTANDTMSSGTNEKSTSFGETTESTSQLPVIGEQDSTGGKVECCPTFCFKRCRRCCMCPPSVHKVWLKIQFVCQWIVLDPLMDLFITVIILLNTLFLSLDHYQIDETYDFILTVGNTMCTVIFTLECVLKLCALGYSYFENNWNNFDLFIVVTSLIELPLANLQGLSVLRTFRLLRVLKLAQSWTTMRILLSIIFSTLGAVANVSVVLVIIIYIFAIIGMQLFGANYIPENFEGGVVPRWNFVDFPHSVMLVFRILCGEWIEPLYDCMNCSNAGLCIAVFISTLLVGNILILNLFLALLLNSFASDSLKKEEEESRLGLAFAKLKRYFLKVLCICCCCLPKRYRNKVSDSNQNVQVETPVEKAKEATENNVHITRTDAFVVVSNADGEHVSDKGLSNGGFDMPDEATNNSEQTWAENHLKVFPNGSVPNGNLPHIHTNGTVRNGSVHSLKENGSIPRPTSVALSTSKNAETGEIETCENKELKSLTNLGGQEPDNKSIANGNATPVPPIDASDEVPVEDPVQPCCPGPVNRWCSKRCPCAFCKPPEVNKVAKWWRTFREFICTVVEHRVFEGIILVCIFISSITLIFDDIYLDEKPTFKDILEILNYVFVGIFFGEMILKWIGLGFKVYFTSFWCLLDFFIVMVSLASVGVQLLGLGEIGAFRSLRTLRALRPLRAISRWQGMKIVVNALAFAIPSIGNVLLVCMMFWLIFAIIGVQLFRGTFYKCVDDSGTIVSIADVKNVTDCLEQGYTWENSKIHFDNVYFAIIALFQVATFEGWMEVMESAVDQRGVDQQPWRESSNVSYIFFFVFIIFGSFFFLNLFIGVIIDNFNTLKRKYEGDRTLDVFMTSSQKNYYQTMRKLGNKKPKKQIRAPTERNKLLSFCYKLTTSTKFEIAIVVVILLNMLAMMVEHHGMQEPLISVLNGVNIAFTVIFCLECILKILALRWYYFKIPWNVFDFIVVVFSVLGIIASDLLAAFINPTLLRVFRLLRIGRILRLVKSAKGLRKLLFALVISLPALLNIGCLLFLVIFIYAIIGMSQFSRVKLQGALDDVVNFQTWTKSMLLLYRVSTSAGWNDILDALITDGPPDCDPTYGGYPNGDCGSTVFALIFFLTFLVLSFLIIINTYIAVILENFSAAHAQEEVGITEDDFGMFYQVWEKYDPNASQFIGLEQLSDFCDDLEMPLRLAKPNQIKLAGLDLPIYYDTKLHCIDVLFALTKRVLGDVDESDDFAELQKQMSEQFLEAFPDLENIKPTTTTMQLNKRNTAAKRLQRAWRLHKLKKELAKAVMASRNKGSNTTSRVASARSSLIPEGEKESTKLESSFNGSVGNDLQVPGNMVGISRATTPTILEVDTEVSENAKKGEKYHVNDDDDVPTIDA